MWPQMWPCVLLFLCARHLWLEFTLIQRTIPTGQSPSLASDFLCSTEGSLMQRWPLFSAFASLALAAVSYFGNPFFGQPSSFFASKEVQNHDSCLWSDGNRHLSPVFSVTDHNPALSCPLCQRRVVKERITTRVDMSAESSGRPEIAVRSPKIKKYLLLLSSQISFNVFVRYWVSSFILRFDFEPLLYASTSSLFGRADSLGSPCFCIYPYLYALEVCTLTVVLVLYFVISFFTLNLWFHFRLPTTCPTIHQSAVISSE